MTLTLVILIGALAGHPLGIILAYKWDAFQQRQIAERETLLAKARWSEYEKWCAIEALRPRFKNASVIRRTDIEAIMSARN